MAKGIVEALEVVNIQYGHADIPLFALGPSNFLDEGFFDWTVLSFFWIQALA